MNWYWVITILCLVWGCKGAERSTSQPTEHPALALRSLAPQAAVDTAFWFDTTKHGDTTYYSRGHAITSVQVFTDSVWHQIILPSVIGGTPFGLFGSWKNNQFYPTLAWATLGYGADKADSIMYRIDYLRSTGKKMVLIPAGGARANYLSPRIDTVKVNDTSFVIDTVKVFDRAKWTAKMQTFVPVKDSILAAYNAGYITAISIMDEPSNDGGPGNEGNSWGPKGTLNTTRVDSLCADTKTLFPGMPVGVFQDWRVFQSGMPWVGQKYKVCDFITSQYRVAKGTLADYKTGAVTEAKRQGIALSIAINVLDGGIPVKRKPGQTDYLPGDCPLTTTGGKGTYFPNCQMTPQQLIDAGSYLGPAGCFLTGFRYDGKQTSDTAFVRAYKTVTAVMLQHPQRSCFRG